jgi:hypothetical protein
MDGPYSPQTQRHEGVYAIKVSMEKKPTWLVGSYIKISSARTMRSLFGGGPTCHTDPSAKFQVTKVQMYYDKACYLSMFAGVQ